MLFFLLMNVYAMDNSNEENKYINAEEAAKEAKEAKKAAKKAKEEEAKEKAKEEAAKKAKEEEKTAFENICGELLDAGKKMFFKDELNEVKLAQYLSKQEKTENCKIDGVEYKIHYNRATA